MDPADDGFTILPCLICNTKARKHVLGSTYQTYAKTLSALIRYPNQIKEYLVAFYDASYNTPNPGTIQEVKSLPAPPIPSQEYLHQLQQSVFCATCAKRFRSIHTLFENLMRLQKRVDEFRREICMDLQSCVNSIDSGGIRSDLRQRVLNDLNLQIKDSSKAQSNANHANPVGGTRRSQEGSREKKQKIISVPTPTPSQYSQNPLPLLLPNISFTLPTSFVRLMPIDLNNVMSCSGTSGTAEIIPVQDIKQENVEEDNVTPTEDEDPYPLDYVEKEVIDSHPEVDHKPDFSSISDSENSEYIPPSRAKKRKSSSHRTIRSLRPDNDTQIKLQCKHCPRSFRNFSTIWSHCRATHPDKKLPSIRDFPGYQFKKVGQSRQLVKSAGSRLRRNSGNETKEEISCKHCTRVFRNFKTLWSHYKNTHPEEGTPKAKDFGIQLKKKQKKEAPQATSAEEATESKQTLICQHCDKPMTTEKQLREHIKRHQKHVKCPSEGCDSAFTDNTELKCHQIRFHPELNLPKVKCPHCDFESNRTDTMKYHIRAKHAPPEELTHCHFEGCKYKAPRPHQIKHHIERVHEQKKNYLCTECGKGYYFENKLNEHMRSHAGDKPFVCNICGKRYLRRDKLKTHQRVHGDERPFVCELCGFRFPTYHNLYGHKVSWHKGGTVRIGVQPKNKGKYNQETKPTSEMQLLPPETRKALI